MREFNCLDQSQSILGHYFLEASAGTGKTFALSHLFVRLVSEGGLSPKEILVVTFTRAATRALKMRIRSLFPPLTAGIDDLPVFTIHAFCRRMLTTYGVEVGLPPPPEEEDWMTRLTDHILDVFRSEASSEEIDKALGTGSLEGYVDKVKALLLKRQVSRDPFLEKLRARLDIAHPDALVEAMRNALDIPAFFDKVASHYQAAVIDEFQDTDPVQWEIFSRLFLERPAKAFVLVGDPKQSIYAFRGADVNTYLAARGQFADGARFTLSTNYRSTPALIASLNALFGEAALALDYRPLSAGAEQEEIGDGEKTLLVVGVEGRRGRSKRWPTEVMEETFFFPHFLGEIIRLHKDHGVPLKEIACLVKDRYQGMRLKEFFDAYRLPARLWSLKPLAESPAFHGMRLFLRLLKQPSDASALREFLLSVFCRASVEVAPEARGKLVALAPLLEEEGFEAACFYLTEMTFGEKKVLDLLREEGCENDFVQIVSLLGKAFSNLDEGLHLMDEMEHASMESHPEYRTVGDSAREEVILLTTHASKGLEFDVVFALGTSTRGFQKEEADEAEALRELYVAATRAKRRVYLPIALEEGGVGDSSFERLCAKLVHPLTLDTLFGKLDRLGIGTRRLHSAVPPCFFTESPTVAKTSRLPLRESPRRIASFSSLVTGTVPHNMEGEASALPASKEFGIVLHRLLENLIERGLYRDDKMLTAYVERKVDASPFAPWTQEIVLMLIEAFQAPLDGFCLKDIPPHHLFAEQEFLFRDTETLWIKGCIDVVACLDHRLYLIDWKSHDLGSVPAAYTPENLHLVIQAYRYEMQAEIYATCLKKYLNHIEERAYEWDFCGAYTLFLRGLKWPGHGVYRYGGGTDVGTR